MSIKINCGCGKNVLHGWENVDKIPSTQGWENVELLKHKIIPVDLTRFWPWQDGTVEAITISHLLYCMTAPEKRLIVHEAFRVLKRYGVLRITDDDNDCPHSHYHKKMHHNSKEPTRKAKIIEYMTEAGFSVVEMDHDRTISPFPEIKIDLHGHYPAIFFLEGCKE